MSVDSSNPPHGSPGHDCNAGTIGERQGVWALVHMRESDNPTSPMTECGLDSAQWPKSGEGCVVTMREFQADATLKAAAKCVDCFVAYMMTMAQTLPLPDGVGEEIREQATWETVFEFCLRNSQSDNMPLGLSARSTTDRAAMKVIIERVGTVVATSDMSPDDMVAVNIHEVSLSQLPPDMVAAIMRTIGHSAGGDHHVRMGPDFSLPDIDNAPAPKGYQN